VGARQAPQRSSTLSDHGGPWLVPGTARLAERRRRSHRAPAARHCRVGGFRKNLKRRPQAPVSRLS
jgi:hypothetical protein